MRLDPTAPTPLQYFATLVHSDEGLPLLEAAASLAQDAEPGLDLEQVLADVDGLALRLGRLVRRSAPVLVRLRALEKFFFGELGFGGNANDPLDPANSHVHAVLRTRRGIPVALAVLWLELARSLDMPVQGLNFPGHFLVQATIPEGRVVIDPLTGRSLGQSQLREWLEDCLPHRPTSPGHEWPLAMFLDVAAPRQILARMLGNLRLIHRARQDWPQLVAVQSRLITLLPQAWSEYRERGLALAELGERQRACADLAFYLERARDAADRHTVMERLEELGGTPS